MEYDDSGHSEWIKHDGNGCPVKAGTIVQMMFASGSIIAGPALECSARAVRDGLTPHGSWDKRNAKLAVLITYYRIRKPNGLTICENLLADLPEKIGA